MRPIFGPCAILGNNLRIDSSLSLLRDDFWLGQTLFAHLFTGNTSKDNFFSKINNSHDDEVKRVSFILEVHSHVVRHAWRAGSESSR